MQQAVIFVRVSKKEQDYQRQVEDLRAVAQSSGRAGGGRDFGED